MFDPYGADLHIRDVALQDGDITCDRIDLCFHTIESLPKFVLTLSKTALPLYENAVTFDERRDLRANLLEQDILALRFLAHRSCSMLTN